MAQTAQMPQTLSTPPNLTDSLSHSELEPVPAASRRLPSSVFPNPSAEPACRHPPVASCPARRLAVTPAESDRPPPSSRRPSSCQRHLGSGRAGQRHRLSSYRLLSPPLRPDPPILTRRNCYAAAWPARSPAKRRILLVGDRQYGTLVSVSPYHGKMHGITLDFLLDPIPRDDARFRSPCLRRGHDQSDPPLWGILISCLLFPKVK